MKRAADLLVEECVAGVPRNGIVAADGDFAQHTGAGVLIQHAQEEFLTLSRRRIHDPAGSESQADALDFSAPVYHGKVEADPAFGGIFDGPGKDLAVGEVLVPVAVDPGPAGRPDA